MASMNLKNDKSLRVLYILDRLKKGEQLNKRSLAYDLGVSEKSIQRDISEINNYLMEIYHDEDRLVKYSRLRNCYYMNKR